MTKFKHISSAFALIVSTLSFSQISPPGLGESKIGQWSAVGIRQNLNDKNNWESMTYTGWGNKSGETSNPYHKKGIWVLNQEFYHKLKNNWQYSIAISYRRQTEYEKDEFEEETEAIQQEFRAYARLNYTIKLGKLSIIPTVRQEVRTFYDDNFSPTDDNLQLRSRFRVQFAYNLDQEKKHRIMASSEQLWSTKRDFATKDWSKLSYQESRFLLYYSFSPQKMPLQFNVGYMNNLLGAKNPHAVHYIAFDVIAKNIFSKKKN